MIIKLWKKCFSLFSDFFKQLPMSRWWNRPSDFIDFIYYLFINNKEICNFFCKTVGNPSDNAGWRKKMFVTAHKRKAQLFALYHRLPLIRLHTWTKACKKSHGRQNLPKVQQRKLRASCGWLTHTIAHESMRCETASSHDSERRVHIQLNSAFRALHRSKVVMQRESTHQHRDNAKKAKLFPWKRKLMPRVDGHTCLMLILKVHNIHSVSSLGKKGTLNLFWLKC